jgi:hypothetical protein
MTYYLAEVLAYLSYKHLYEVLNVIIKISKEVDTKGDEIVSTLRATVKDEVPGIQEAAKHGAQLVLLIRLRRLLQEVYTLNDKYVLSSVSLIFLENVKTIWTMRKAKPMKSKPFLVKTLEFNSNSQRWINYCPTLTQTKSMQKIYIDLLNKSITITLHTHSM